MNCISYFDCFLGDLLFCEGKTPQVRLVTACDPGESAANSLSAQRLLQATLTFNDGINLISLYPAIGIRYSMKYILIHCICVVFYKALLHYIVF